MKKVELNPKSDELFQDSSDCDECDNEELEHLFSNCELLCETMVNKNQYILHVSATNEFDATIATCLSNQSCKLYKLRNSGTEPLMNISELGNTIIGCKYSVTDNNLLYTGSAEGTFKLWDMRIPSKPAVTLKDITVHDNKTKTFNCFDVSSNDRLLTAGSDLFDGDAFLLFWDTRSSQCLGGYWDSHTDDITQVKFHPNHMDTLMSGSIDGLINIYDLSKSCEDDALIETLNTESSVEQLLWFTENGKSCISCITHVADLQLWNLIDTQPYQHITRTDLAHTIRRTNEGYIYIASHQAQTSLLVLVGSNYQNGECIRGLQVDKGQIKPALGFKGNNQRVRCSSYSENTNFLFAGGEEGLLDVWKVIKKD